MYIKYLKHVKKWVAIQNGKAVAIGETNKQALNEGIARLIVLSKRDYNIN
jgi:hypothetical protein